MADFDFEPITKDTTLRHPDESREDLFLGQYNYAFAVNLLESFMQKIEDEEDILTVQQLFKGTGLSSSYMKKLVNHFNTEPYIEVLAANIFDILEARVLERGLLNQTNASMTQFYLKNKFYWNDKLQIDQHTTSAQADTLSDDQKKMIAERYTTITE